MNNIDTTAVKEPNKVAVAERLRKPLPKNQTLTNAELSRKRGAQGAGWSQGGWSVCFC